MAYRATNNNLKQSSVLSDYDINSIGWRSGHRCVMQKIQICRTLINCSNMTWENVIIFMFNIFCYGNLMDSDGGDRTYYGRENSDNLEFPSLSLLDMFLGKNNWLCQRVYFDREHLNEVYDNFDLKIKTSESEKEREIIKYDIISSIIELARNEVNYVDLEYPEDEQ